jgi:hypothetical protein
MGVIVLLSDNRNAHTTRLLSFWPGICDKITDIYPDMKFLQYTNWNQDKDLLPKSFELYSRWFPQIVYFPDGVWYHEEMIDLKQNSYVMNGVFNEMFNDYKELQFDLKYNFTKENNYITWLNEIENNRLLIKEPDMYN